MKASPASKVLNPSQKLAKAYGDWLNTMPWTFFVTMTAPYPNGLSLPAARRLAERTHKGLKALADGNCTMFFVMERNQLRDGHHMHALLHMPERFHQPHLYSGIIDTYQAMVGAKLERNDGGKLTWSGRGRIDVQRFDKRKNAAGYCLKYMMKARNGPADYDLL